MARKKRAKKISWLKTALLYVLVPLTVWFFAFIVWLYWDDIAKLFSKDAPRASRRLEKADKAPAPTKPPRERILDDDRKKLEEILKQRQ